MARGDKTGVAGFGWETFAFVTRRAIRRNAWTSLDGTFFYEAPSEDPAELEAWCYTDRPSYAPGDEVRFHVSTTASTFDLDIARDGARPQTVARWSGLRGTRHPTPADAYATGCGWPAGHTWRIPADAPSGAYVVTTRVADDKAGVREQVHLFVVHPAPGTPRQGRTLLIAATGTWTAYNDWGGANHYQGIAGPHGCWPSPVLSLERPWSRGFVRLPVGAPRSSLEAPVRPGGAARYANREWAFANGYARFYASAGWASYDRHFVVWAERHGYAVDVVTQHDLHFRPEVLEGYGCVVVVGHDEYWSWEMRDAIDEYVERGGHVARFGANFMWQIRFEDEGRRQVCYKYVARDHDPLRGAKGEELRRLSSTWEDPMVGRPGASTMGLNALYGIYTRIGVATPRAPGGFTVYRPDHWVFAGTDLYYGDMFGAEAGIVGYEVDAVDYTFRDGLPFPTFADGAPETLSILAMAPAVMGETDRGHFGSIPGIGATDGLFKAMVLYNDTSPQAIERVMRGAGMVAHFTRGAGEVFNAATCEWVKGLIHGCAMTERITRNVLDRFLFQS
ncbi:MAG: N,N-dimethylformamidase beta subunit family domain-containing protein [Alphaproteobacteria bacterium]